MFLFRNSIKKESGGGRWGGGGGRFLLLPTFVIFPIGCFLYTLLPSPGDKLEFSGQILKIKTSDIDKTQVCLLLIHILNNNVIDLSATDLA